MTLTAFIEFLIEVGGGVAIFTGVSASQDFYCAIYGTAISDVLDVFITDLTIGSSLLTSYKFKLSGCSKAEDVIVFPIKIITRLSSYLKITYYQSQSTEKCYFLVFKGQQV